MCERTVVCICESNVIVTTDVVRGPGLLGVFRDSSVLRDRD
jgi:hypothetical protein